MDILLRRYAFAQKRQYTGTGAMMTANLWPMISTSTPFMLVLTKL